MGSILLLRTAGELHVQDGNGGAQQHHRRGPRRPRGSRPSRSYARRLRPSVVIAANAYALLYASCALRSARLSAPLAVTFHSTRLQGLKEQVKMTLERPFFWTADCLIFVCERQKEHWLRRGLFARRNEVIHNGVDTAEFCDAWNGHPRTSARQSYGFAEADYVIGLSAVLRPEKNPLQLVEAVARLRGLGIPARALLIGDGEMRPAVEACARRLEIAEHVVNHRARVHGKSKYGLERYVRGAIDLLTVMTITKYGRRPAHLFGGLGMIAVLTKNEVLSVLLGGIFVVEAVSVLGQIAAFQLFGKRIFLMAPIHHHFEKKGWAEPKVIVRFWIISMMLAIASLSTLKLR